jgi:hypothetical protein
MNKIWRDEVAFAISAAKLKNENIYLDDHIIAEEVLGYLVKRLEGVLEHCLNIKEGRCMTWYKHEECLRLQYILFDITSDPRYMTYEMLQYYEKGLL